MSAQVATSDVPDAVVPYVPSRRKNVEAPTQSGDRVELAGQAVLGLLRRAAETAEANSRHALDIAHKLSRELHAAEGRIADLEADLRHYQDRAERAERWLNQISVEIEQRFFGSPNKKTA